MAITNATDIKTLVKSDIDTAELANAAVLADKQIVALTGRPIGDWDPSYPAYGALESIGAVYAAWLILSGWDKDMYLDKAKMMWQNYVTQVESFKKLPIPEDLTNPDVDIVESNYTIHALNPDVTNFLSYY